MILSRNIREVLCNWVVLIKSPTATEELQISLAVQIFPRTSSCDAKSSSQRLEKYHNLLVPDFELGCKRKIADPEYLDSLNRDNVELIPEGLQRITEDGIISTSGRDDRFDIIVTATGFKVSQFLTPMDVIGANGSTLEQQ